MGCEEDAGAVEEGVGGEEDDGVDEDRGPDCGCELGWALVGCVSCFPSGGNTNDPDAGLGDDGCACSSVGQSWMLASHIYRLGGEEKGKYRGQSSMLWGSHLAGLHPRLCRAKVHLQLRPALRDSPVVCLLLMPWR